MDTARNVLFGSQDTLMMMMIWALGCRNSAVIWRLSQDTFLTELATLAYVAGRRLAVVDPK